MIIVLEGPDFAGKSTLAAKMRNSIFHQAERGEGHGIDIKIEHTGQPDEGVNLFGHYVQRILEARDRALVAPEHTHTIFDRLHVGEAIYGPVYRSHSQLSEAQLRAIDELLDDLGATKVFVDAPDSVLLERFRGDRGDDLVSSEHELKRIANEYRTRIGGQHGDGAHGFLPGWITWTEAHSVAAGYRLGQ